MTSLIEGLWLAENLPIQDGLYRADGAVYGVQLDASIEGGLKILAPFSLEEFLSCHPDMVTSIDTTLEIPLPHSLGYVCCGEGSYGSEGFFGRLDQHRKLIAGLGLPVQGQFKLQDMLQAWMRDKKYRHGIRFVVLNQLGQPESGVTADEATLEGVLSDLAGR